MRTGEGVCEEMRRRGQGMNGEIRGGKRGVKKGCPVGLSSQGGSAMPRTTCGAEASLPVSTISKH